MIEIEPAADGVRVTRHAGRLPVFVVVPRSRIREFCAAILAIIEADAGQVRNTRSQSVECHVGEPIRVARTRDGLLRVSRLAGGIDHFIIASESAWADVALRLLEEDQ